MRRVVRWRRLLAVHGPARSSPSSIRRLLSGEGGGGMVLLLLRSGGRVRRSGRGGSPAGAVAGRGGESGGLGGGELGGESDVYLRVSVAVCRLVWRGIRGVDGSGSARRRWGRNPASERCTERAQGGDDSGQAVSSPHNLVCGLEA